MLSGVKFNVYAKEDIVSPDGLNTIYYKADELVEIAMSNKKGEVVFKADLPLGKYYVKEVYAGEGFVRNPEIQNFEITAQDEHVNFQWIESVYQNDF